MRYYRKKKREYSAEYGQLCWSCTKCYGGCSWSREFKPVDGWQAVPVTIPQNGEHSQSYKISYCPEYTPEK